jgi:hypothetical protein
MRLLNIILHSLSLLTTDNSPLTTDHSPLTSSIYIPLSNHYQRWEGVELQSKPEDLPGTFNHSGFRVKGKECKMVFRILYSASFPFFPKAHSSTLVF